MNKKIRELTEASILLAVYGAILLINRYIAGALNILMFTISSLIVVFYRARYPKTNFFYALIFGVAFLSFLFGGININIFAPMGIVLGIIYSYGVSKDIGKYKILLMMSIVACAYEVIAATLILPIFGLNLSDNVAEIKFMLEQIQNINNTNLDFNSLLFSDNSLMMITIIGLMLTGIMESYVVYLMANLLLKKFKLKTPKILPLIEYKLPIWLTYILFICFIVGVIGTLKTADPIIFSYAVLLTFAGGVLLLFYGYIAVIIYFKIIYKFNVGIILIILMVLFNLYTMFTLVIIGFLYLSGPLRKHIIEKGKI